jgi:hypothetical protein
MRITKSSALNNQHLKERSRTGEACSRIQSLEKIPKLYDLIDQWKLEVKTDQTNLDASLKVLNSIHDKDVPPLRFRSTLII